MSTSPDDQPTVVQPATAGRPGVIAAPATRRTRIWGHRVPARIGRARTSTVVIGCLWLLLFALNLSLPQNTYTTVTTDTGQTVRVRTSDLTGVPAPSTTTPTTDAGDQPPPTSAPAGSSAPATAATSAPGQQTGTAAPRTSTSAPRTTASTSASPSTGTTSRAPATSAEPSPSTPAPSDTAAPTT